MILNDPENHSFDMDFKTFFSPEIVVIDWTNDHQHWHEAWEIMGTVSCQERDWISVVVRVRDRHERLMLQLMWPTLDKAWFWQRLS